MGTWAVGSFGNDAAGDWVIDLQDNPTYEFLRETIQASIEDPGEADSNECAIAAAEVLAIIDGQLPKDYVEVAHNLSGPVATLKQTPVPADLKPLAIEALNGILAESELADLWEGDEEWIAEVKRLIRELGK